MRPIPKFLLIHSATLKKESAENVWGKKTNTSTSLSGVRFEPVNVRHWNVQEGLPEATVRMFFDCHNSAPVGTTFDTGDVITFNSRDYKITNVSSLYDERGLHHYEVYLI
jgi:hypothetical protein